MKCTNDELGKKILKDSCLPIISADNIAQAGQKVVAAIKKNKKPKPKPKPKPKRKAARKKAANRKKK
jgi:hypothetical protein